VGLPFGFFPFFFFIVIYERGILSIFLKCISFYSFSVG
jgi:hypothetical protein